MPCILRNSGNRIDEINGSGKRGELKSPGDLPALQLPGRTSGETIGKVRRRNYITIYHGVPMCHQRHADGKALSGMENSCKTGNQR